MVGFINIIVIIFFYFSVQLFYFIITATSHIKGWNSNSNIWVGKNYKPSTGIGIPIHICVCLVTTLQ
jgi:hypothetical protein